MAAKPHWLLRKILRKSSSSYSVKTKTPKPLKPVSRRVSVADLPKRGRVDLLKDKSLEDLARLGGVSLFMLPAEFAATQLALPVGLCATAAYIWQHGKFHSPLVVDGFCSHTSRSQHARYLPYQRTDEYDQQGL